MLEYVKKYDGYIIKDYSDCAVGAKHSIECRFEKEVMMLADRLYAGYQRRRDDIARIMADEYNTTFETNISTDEILDLLGKPVIWADIESVEYFDHGKENVDFMEFEFFDNDFNEINLANIYLSKDTSKKEHNGS